MSKYLTSLKHTVLSLAVLALLGTGLSVAKADTFSTGDIDFGGIAPIAASITSANLVKWRQPGLAAGQSPVAATSLSFAYLQSGTNLATPSRTAPADNSANNQGYLWSDNAIRLAYVKPNNTDTAILIYTNNAPINATDPLNSTALRGGLVGGSGNPDNPNRASVLPLVWKAASLLDLQKISNVNIDGSVKIPNTSLLYMPSYISAAAGGACAAEGPYTAATRAGIGFCDFSTHFFLDKNNTDPNNLWFSEYTTNPAKKLGAYNYASLANAFGTSTTEQGVGLGADNPMFAVLGVGAANALRTQYGTSINVDVISF